MIQPLALTLGKKKKPKWLAEDETEESPRARTQRKESRNGTVFFSPCVSQNINSEADACRETRMLFEQKGKGFSAAAPAAPGSAGQVA